MDNNSTLNEKPLWMISNPRANGAYNHRVKSQLWKIVKMYFFKITPYQFSSLRVWILRRFGAKIGKGCYIAPTVDFTRPWYLEIGDNVSIDDFSCIDPPVIIESNTAIAKRCLIISDGHDVRSRGFDYYENPIRIGASVFIGAGSFIGNGVRIGQFACIGARSTVLKDVPENTIAFGNPCSVHSERIPELEYKKYRFK